MTINQDLIKSNLLYNLPVKYDEHITLYPVTMKNILDFQMFQRSIIVRKDSIFTEKTILKMEYLDFLKYARKNNELAEKYEMKELVVYFDFLLYLLKMTCGENSKVEFNENTLDIFINDELITNEIFNDLRRIIIIQNGINFDPDEFISLDVIRALEKAQEFEDQKSNEHADIEDYIDSVVIALKMSEEEVSNLSIRKFWRYVKRISKHEEYVSYSIGRLSGFVTFKKPLSHWMTSIEVTDKYENLKADESELRSKIG